MVLRVAQGLTLPKRPRDAKMPPGGPPTAAAAAGAAGKPGAGAGKPAGAPPEPLARAGASTPSPSPASAGAPAGAAGKPPAPTASGAGALADMPGADLPPVIAPPGRTRGNARVRAQTGSLSRPSSIHVDDFQRGVGDPMHALHGAAAPDGQPGGPRGGGGQRGGEGMRGMGMGPGHGGGPGQGMGGGPSLAQLLSDPGVIAVGTSPLLGCPAAACVPACAGRGLTPVLIEEG